MHVYASLPLQDDDLCALVPWLPPTLHFLDTRLDRNGADATGGVLVHCSAGINRSGAVVVACVAHRLRVSLAEAARHVLARRPRSLLLTNEHLQRELVRWAARAGRLGEVQQQEKEEEEGARAHAVAERASCAQVGALCACAHCSLQC